MKCQLLPHVICHTLLAFGRGFWRGGGEVGRGVFVRWVFGGGGGDWMRGVWLGGGGCSWGYWLGVFCLRILGIPSQSIRTCIFSSNVTCCINCLISKKDDRKLFCWSNKDSIVFTSFVAY